MWGDPKSFKLYGRLFQVILGISRVLKHLSSHLDSIFPIKILFLKSSLQKLYWIVQGQVQAKVGEFQDTSSLF